MLGAQVGAEGKSWMGGGKPKTPFAPSPGAQPYAAGPEGRSWFGGGKTPSMTAAPGSSPYGTGLGQGAFGSPAQSSMPVKSAAIGFAPGNQSPYGQMSPKQQWRMGQAQSIQAPSQGTPYGQPLNQAGLRAHTDPTNPVGPNYNPNAQPSAPFGQPNPYPGKRDMGGFRPVTPGSRPPADPYSDVRDMMQQYPGVDPNELRRLRDRQGQAQRDNAADRFRQDIAKVAPPYERNRVAANQASADQMQRRMAADITPQAMAMGMPDNGGVPFQMPAGLRAWNDPTNPRGPTYNPNAVPSQLFGYGAGYFY
jgi:hypothetical protein